MSIVVLSDTCCLSPHLRANSTFFQEFIKLNSAILKITLLIFITILCTCYTSYAQSQDSTLSEFEKKYYPKTWKRAILWRISSEEKFRSEEKIWFTPDQRDKGEAIVPADLIVGAIRKKKNVEIDCAVIDGNLDFWDTVEPKPIKDALEHIKKSQKEDQPYHQKVEYYRPIEPSITITHSVINGRVSAVPKSFAPVVFMNRVNFSGTKFEKKADFCYSYFNTDSIFEMATFSSADFHKTTFYGNVSFKKAHFKEVNFDSTRFHQEEEIDPYNTWWGVYWVLKDKEKQVKNVVLDIRNMRFDHLVGLTWEQIAIPITLNYFKESDQQKEFETIRNTYFSLENNFKTRGQFEDAIAIYYERKVLERMNRKDPWWLCWVKIPEIIIIDFGSKYGTSFKRIALTAVSSIFTLFCLLYFLPNVCRYFLKGRAYWAFLKGRIEKYEYQERLKEINESYPLCRKDDSGACKPAGFCDALYLSFIVFGLGSGDNNIDVRGRLRWVIVFGGLLGWFMLAMFIFTLTVMILK